MQIGAVLLLLCSIFSMMEPSRTAKILLMAPIGGRSQKNVFYGLGRGLVERGHNVTLFSGYRPATPVKGITELVPDSFYEIFKEGNVINVIEATENGFLSVWRQAKRVLLDSHELLLSSKELEHVMEEQWDLVVFGAFTQSVYYIPYMKQIPFIFLTPISYLPMLTSNLGNPTLPSLVPFPILSQTLEEGNFFVRVKNVVAHTVIHLIIKYFYMPYCDRLVSEKFGALQIPPSSVLERNASLILLNSNPAIDYGQALLPNTVPVGGVHCESPEVLPSDIQKFIGSSEFVYFSLGSVIRPENLTTTQRNTIVTVLGQLPFKVLLKWDSESGAGLPDNVIGRRWFNQQNILGHRHCRLFISHAGAASFQESICHGVPLLALPVTGDQLGNAERARQIGVAAVLPWDQLSVEGLLRGVQEASKNQLREEAQRRRRLMFSPHHPRALAVSWVEMVIREGGAKHVRGPATEMNVIQYYSLDVVVFLVSIGAGTFLLYCIFVRFCCRQCWRCATSGKSNRKAKKLD